MLPPTPRSSARISRITSAIRRSGASRLRVVLINQLLQSTFVSLLVLAFLLTFGLIVVPAPVQAGWIGEPVTVLVQLDLLGEPRVLSAELLFVCTLLSGIVGLYFTGLDPTYRAEHVTAVVGELRMFLAARALYLVAIQPGPETAAARPRGRVDSPPARSEPTDAADPA